MLHRKKPALVKPRFEEKFLLRVLLSPPPLGISPKGFYLRKALQGHYIMPNSKGFQLRDATLLFLPLPPPSGADLQMPCQKKKLKIPKHTVALKGEHCPIKSPCVVLAAGCAPQETSAAFPREDTDSPMPIATYKGFPALTVTGNRMEKRLGRRLPSRSAGSCRSKAGLAELGSSGTRDPQAPLLPRGHYNAAPGRGTARTPSPKRPSPAWRGSVPSQRRVGTARSRGRPGGSRRGSPAAGRSAPIPAPRPDKAGRAAAAPQRRQPGPPASLTWVTIFFFSINQNGGARPQGGKG